jgi:MFS family permease
VGSRTSRIADSLALLRERPLKLLFAAQAISVFGDMLVPVALAFAVLGLTGSPSDLGLVLFARFLPMVVFFLAGGVYGDRLEGRTVCSSSRAVLLLPVAAPRRPRYAVGRERSSLDRLGGVLHAPTRGELDRRLRTAKATLRLETATRRTG